MKRMLQLGVKATCNSDDPAYFGGYLADNYARTAQAVGLDRNDIIALSKNSFTGSFLDEADVKKHLAAVDAFAATN